jgi:hypothetical protein
MVLLLSGQQVSGLIMLGLWGLDMALFKPLVLARNRNKPWAKGTPT